MRLRAGTEGGPACEASSIRTSAHPTARSSLPRRRGHRSVHSLVYGRRVLCVAAVVSYDHAYALVRRYGEDGWTAKLVPLTVDGLIFASSMVLPHCARRQTAVPRLPRWLLGLGIAATLAANATHGVDHGPVGAVVAAWPAVALVGTYELLMLLIRTGRAPAQASAGVRVSGKRRDTESVPAGAPGANRRRAPVPHNKDVPVGAPADEALERQAAQAFAEQIATGALPSIRTIRSRPRVGQPRAQQIRAHLAARAAAAIRQRRGRVKCPRPCVLSEEPRVVGL